LRAHQGQIARDRAYTDTVLTGQIGHRAWLTLLQLNGQLVDPSQTPWCICPSHDSNRP